MTTQKVDASADVIAIEQLWSRYTFELDRRNFSGVADLFAADGVYEIYHRDKAENRCDPALTDGSPIGANGHENIVSFLTAVYDQQLGHHDLKPWPAGSYHTVANTLVEIDGDSATMHAYLVGAGTYDSTFVRTDAGWKVVRNRVILDDQATTEGWPALLGQPRSDASSGGTAAHVAAESVADIVAINQLSSRSAYELDRRNFDGVADLFTPDGSYEIYHRNLDTGEYDPATNAGAEIGAKGHDNIVAFLREIQQHNSDAHGLTPWPTSPYTVLTNELVEIDGDSATMHAYLVDGGTYDSTFVRTDTGWKVVRNRIVLDEPAITEGWPALLGQSQPPVAGRTGRGMSFTDEESRDIIEINQLWTRYAFELDKRNMSGVADLFTEDGGIEIYYKNVESSQYQAENDGADCVAIGHENMVALFTEMWVQGQGVSDLRPFPVSPYHSITNRVIELYGDEARLHAYLGGGWGTYDNTFRRTPEGWKAFRNRIVIDNRAQWVDSIHAASLAFRK